MRNSRPVIAVIAAAAVLGGLTASPAFAQPPPGIFNGLISGTVNAGQTGTAPAFTATVTTNDQSGYILVAQLNGEPEFADGVLENVPDFNDYPGDPAGTVHAIPDDAWSVATGTGAPQGFNAGDTPITLVTADSPSAAGGDVYDQTLSVAVPGNQAPSVYNGTVGYAAVGS